MPHHAVMDRFTVFSHLSTPKAAEYRSILECFAEARGEFVLHLRPAEVARKVGLDEVELADALEQLNAWGNLDRSRDHGEASSIEEFYKVKFLYQLSSRGEAAERALELFVSSVDEPGELQAEALRDIIEYLSALLRLLDNDDVTPANADYAKLHEQLRILNGRFEEFTVQAQKFMQFLQTTLELHGLSLEDFIDYKDRLIDYLERFVGELITSTNEIEQRIAALERADLRAYFPGIAKQAKVDALNPDDADELDAERRRREGRWDGLRRWFLGDADGGSQAEMLRARAREAIPSLLLALQSFHDKRETGSDRRRDWRQLARWFAEVPDDATAHRLWRVAFAMAPARHLRVNEETLAYREQVDEGTRTSWLEAEPMWLEAQLRTTGRAPQTAQATKIVDLSAERRELARLAEEENAQIARAHELLVTDGALWLSDFSQLEPSAFGLLLDLLGHVVSKSVGVEADEFPIEASSTDGSLLIECWPAREGGRLAALVTNGGVLSGPDFRISIRRAS
ncbi:MAG: hypothetical protein ACI8XO_000429 [Verrucomicrobiales bacterium]